MRGSVRKGVSVAASIAMALALVPAAALMRPQTAEAATIAPDVEVTRVNTGKITLAKGMSYKLGATATKGAKITYKSSKKSVVSVSSKGTITLNKTGKATITVTATLGKKKDTEKISVTSVKPSKYVAVKKAAMSLSDSDLRVGESCKATVTFTPKNASNKNVIFKSSNPAVLSVNAQGVVTTVGEGQATITATSCANKKAKTTLKVSVAPAAEEEGEEQPEQPNEPEQPAEPDQPAAPEQPSQGGGTPSYPSGGGGGSSIAGGNDNSSSAPTIIQSESIEIDDEYSSTVTYAEGVKAIAGADYAFTANSLGIQTVTITSPGTANVASIKNGDTIVLEPTAANPSGCVVTVGSISAENGTITITGAVPAAEDVFEDIDAQGVSTTISSFEPAAGVEIVNDTSNTMSLRAKKPAGTESISMGTLTLKIPEAKFDSGTEATIEVKFKAAAEYLIKGLGKDMTAYVGINQESSLTATIESKNALDKYGKGSLLLGTLKFPTEVPGMFIAVNLYATLSLKGSVELSFSSTGDIGWLYKDGKHQMVASLKQGCDGVKADGTLKAGLDFDLSLDILSKPIIDAALGLGENLKASLTLRPSALICVDAEIGAYGSLSVGKHSALKDFGITYEMDMDLGDFFPNLNSKAHFENLHKVSACTWNDISDDYGFAGDFSYIIKDGSYGYGAYATYIGDGGSVTVPERIGGQLVVSVDCSDKGITALNVRDCSGLAELWCDNNNISSLDVTKCGNLVVLICSHNNLTSLDVTKCPKLGVLYCESKKGIALDPFFGEYTGARISSLDLTGCPNLYHLSCSFNDLSELDVTNCPSLYWLDCIDNKISSLNVSNCTHLKYLNCSMNRISSLNLESCGQLETLGCGQNQIRELDLSKCPNITAIGCNQQRIDWRETSQGNVNLEDRMGCLEKLVVHGCFKLTSIVCQENALTSIDCSGLAALTELDVSFNKLSSLNVEGCSALKILKCTQNIGSQLTSLNLLGCKNLEELDCSYNYELNTIDVSACSKLKTLSCSGIGLTTLDVSNNTGLVTLYCAWNSLGELDVSQCTQLESLDCSENNIEALDVSNCQKLHTLLCDETVTITGNQVT